MKKRIYYKTAVYVFWLIFLFFSTGVILAHPGKQTTARKLSGSSRTYYIDGIHGSDNNSGTLKSPWKTLKKISKHKFAPGDTAFFARGSNFKCGFVITSSGKPGKPIVFTAYGNGPTPIFTNPGYDNLNGNAIQVKGSYIIVDGLYFYNCPKSPVCKDVRTLGAIFIPLGADHNIIKNCEMTKTPIGIQVYGQYNLITHNYIHDDNVPIRPHWGPIGVVVCTSNNEVSYNRFENYCAPSNEYGHDGGAIEVNDGTIEKVNLNIHHNYSSRNQGFLETIGGKIKKDNWVISYNVCDDFQTFLGLTNVTNLRVEHNTVIRVRRHEGYNDVIWFNDENSVIFRNNIFVLGNGIPPVYYHGDGKKQYHDHNLYFCSDRKTFENGKTYNVLGAPLGTGEIIANPLFVDFKNHDLHLRAGSSAIDSGVDLGYKKDFDQNPVPSGKAPDMGAYEYQKNH